MQFLVHAVNKYYPGGLLATATTRQRLMDAAVEAFAENGFAGTTTRDIAARAGMSPAAVYVHHDSKESLLFSVSLAGHQNTLAVIAESYGATDDSIARVRQMVYDFTRWHAENSRVGRIVQYEFHALGVEHRREIAGIRRQIDQFMRDALEDGIRENRMEIDDVPGTALALLSLGIDVVRWFDPAGPLSSSALAELYARLAVRMVQNREPTTGG